MHSRLVDDDTWSEETKALPKTSCSEYNLHSVYKRRHTFCTLVTTVLCSTASAFLHLLAGRLLDVPETQPLLPVVRLELLDSIDAVVDESEACRLATTKLQQSPPLSDLQFH